MQLQHYANFEVLTLVLLKFQLLTYVWTGKWLIATGKYHQSIWHHISEELDLKYSAFIYVETAVTCR